jgi:hypothetical protein
MVTIIFLVIQLLILKSTKNYFNFEQERKLKDFIKSNHKVLFVSMN